MYKNFSKFLKRTGIFLIAGCLLKITIFQVGYAMMIDTSNDPDAGSYRAPEVAPPPLEKVQVIDSSDSTADESSIASNTSTSGTASTGSSAGASAIDYGTSGSLQSAGASSADASNYDQMAQQQAVDTEGSAGPASASSTSAGDNTELAVGLIAGAAALGAAGIGGYMLYKRSKSPSLGDLKEKRDKLAAQLADPKLDESKRADIQKKYDDADKKYSSAYEKKHGTAPSGVASTSTPAASSALGLSNEAALKNMQDERDELMKKQAALKDGEKLSDADQKRLGDLDHRIAQRQSQAAADASTKTSGLSFYEKMKAKVAGLAPGGGAGATTAAKPITTPVDASGRTSVTSTAVDAKTPKPAAKPGAMPALTPEQEAKQKAALDAQKMHQQQGASSSIVGGMTRGSATPMAGSENMGVVPPAKTPPPSTARPTPQTRPASMPIPTRPLPPRPVTVR